MTPSRTDRTWILAAPVLCAGALVLLFARRPTPPSPAPSNAIPAGARAVGSVDAADIDGEEASTDPRDAGRLPVLETMRSGTVVGTITWPDERPASVYVNVEPERRPALLPEFRTMSRSDGSFELREQPAGRYRLIAGLTPTHGFCYSTVFEVTLGSTVRVDLVLEPANEHPDVPGGAISGQLWLRESPGGPVAPMRTMVGGMRLVAYDRDGNGVAVTTDTRGRFTLRGLDADEYTMLVGEPDRRAEVGNRFRTGSHGVRLIAVEGSGPWSGRVKDHRGDPVARFRVTLFERHGEAVFRRGSVVGRRGEFVLQSLPPGSYDFEFVAEGHAPLVLTHAVTGDPNEQLEVFLQQPR
jgi:hypothetical protein